MSDETSRAERPSPNGGGNGDPLAAAEALPLRRMGESKWPWWGQLILAIVALGTACSLLIVIPTHVASMHGEVGVVNRSLMAMITVFVGLTTMTISGMFLFMTFRIDRGAKAEAGKIAEKEAKKVAKEVARKVAEDRVKDKIDFVRAQAETVEKIKVAGGEAVGLIGEAGNAEVAKIKETGSEAVGRVGEAGDAEVAKIEEAGGESTAEVRRSGEDAKNEIEETGREERDQMERAGNEAKEKVKKAGDDAVEEVGEVRDREAIPKVRAAGEKVGSEADQMIEEARRKIDEADIKKLVKERLDAVLKQAGGRPGRFFSQFRRRREPRS